MAEKKKELAKKVEVEAIEKKTERWEHDGELMKPGDTAKVTEPQAAMLKEKGLVK